MVGVEQSCDLAPAQHHKRVARMRHTDQLAGQSGRSSVCVKKNRNAETMLFMVGARHAAIALFDLEAAHIIRRRRVG